LKSVILSNLTVSASQAVGTLLSVIWALVMLAGSITYGPQESGFGGR